MEEKVINNEEKRFKVMNVEEIDNQLNKAHLESVLWGGVMSIGMACSIMLAYSIGTIPPSVEIIPYDYAIAGILGATSSSTLLFGGFTKLFKSLIKYGKLDEKSELLKQIESQNIQDPNQLKELIANYKTENSYDTYDNNDVKGIVNNFVDRNSVNPNEVNPNKKEENISNIDNVIESSLLDDFDQRFLEVYNEMKENSQEENRGRSL